MRGIAIVALVAACGSKGSKPAAKDAGVAAIAKDAAPPDARALETDQPLGPGDPYDDLAIAAGTLRVTTAPSRVLHLVAIDTAGAVTDTPVTTDASGTVDIPGLIHDGTVAYHVLGVDGADRLESDAITMGATGVRVELARGGLLDGQEQVPADQVWVSIAGTPASVTLVDVATGAEIAPTGTVQGQAGPTVGFSGLTAGAVYVARADTQVSRPLLMLPGAGVIRTVSMLGVPMVTCIANLYRTQQGLHGWSRCQVWQPGGAPRVLATPLQLPLPAGAAAITIRDPRLPLRVDAGVVTWTALIRPGVVEVDGEFDLAVTGGRAEVVTDAPQAMARMGYSVETSRTLAVGEVTGGQYQPPDFSEGEARHLVWADYVKGGTQLRFVITGIAAPTPCELLQVASWTATGDPAPAPDVVAHDRSGAEVRLSDLRGKPVMLNLFASWTPPSAEEAKSLMALARVIGPVGAQLVVVASDNNFAAVDKLIPPSSGVTVWLDPPGDGNYVLGPIAHAFGTTKLPETYLIDGEGLVRHWIVNARDWTSPDALACLQTLKTPNTGPVTSPPAAYVPPPTLLGGTITLGTVPMPADGVLLISAGKRGEPPLAFITVDRPTFPQSFHMSASDLILADSHFVGAMEVTARIAIHPGAQERTPGDVFGTARAKAGDTNVQITIDQVVR